MDIIKYLRTQAGLSQKELADLLHVNQTAVSQWERGVTYPNMPTLLALSDIFGVSSDCLLRGNHSPQDTPTHKGVRIPVLGTVAAGLPIEAIEDIVDFEEIPESWTRGGKEYFGLKVKGDSMYPKYLEGDTVIVLKQNTCESRQDCVVYVNGYDATLKTVLLNENGSLTLQPQNPTYPPTTYSKDKVVQLPVLICGVVAELRRSFL